jgi:hypothetical protein
MLRHCRCAGQARRLVTRLPLTCGARLSQAERAFKPWRASLICYAYHYFQHWGCAESTTDSWTHSHIELNRYGAGTKPGTVPNLECLFAKKVLKELCCNDGKETYLWTPTLIRRCDLTVCRMGFRYVPAEQDGAIQSGMNAGGFWYPDEKPKTVAELIAECECLPTLHCASSMFSNVPLS